MPATASDATPPRTTVVNRHHESYDTYIGRGTLFGNDSHIGPDGSRGEVIAKFQVAFLARLRTDPAFRLAVERLRGQRLGCSCKPKACHGDVIAAWLNGDPELAPAPEPEPDPQGSLF